jgi:hypothetical protein
MNVVVDAFAIHALLALMFEHILPQNYWVLSFSRGTCNLTNREFSEVFNLGGKIYGMRGTKTSCEIDLQKVKYKKTFDHILIKINNAY